MWKLHDVQEVIERLVVHQQDVRCLDVLHELVVDMNLLASAVDKLHDGEHQALCR